MPVLVALYGQTLTNDSVKNNGLLVASMEYGFFTDRDDGAHTKGSTPFLVVKVKPSMMIRSMPVQCKGVEDQATIKETVDSLN